jgi:hypothetical protein
LRVTIIKVSNLFPMIRGAQSVAQLKREQVEVRTDSSMNFGRRCSHRTQWGKSLCPGPQCRWGNERGNLEQSSSRSLHSILNVISSLFMLGQRVFLCKRTGTGGVGEEVAVEIY